MGTMGYHGLPWVTLHGNRWVLWVIMGYHGLPCMVTDGYYGLSWVIMHSNQRVLPVWVVIGYHEFFPFHSTPVYARLEVAFLCMVMRLQELVMMLEVPFL